MWCTHVAGKLDGSYALWQNENLVNIQYGLQRSLVTRSSINVPMKLISYLRNKKLIVECECNVALMVASNPCHIQNFELRRK